MSQAGGDIFDSHESFQNFRKQFEHQSSIVDDLLFEIYDRWQEGRHDSFESDTFTECSSTSDVYHWRRNSLATEIDNNHSGRLHQSVLETKNVDQLQRTIIELQHRGNHMSSRLVRQLKRRERRQAKLQHNCDIVTAVLQASSLKRRIDTRMRFSIEPPPGDSAFEQWKDAMKAVARLPLGIPDEFRKKVWLSLADNHIRELRIDWERTVRFAFNDRSNPDDNKLGLQIVKDLHRTGCSGFSGEDNEEDRASLKRVLLAYARWNKNVGYCQGFNVMAALLLEVVDRKEADALKVMIYLIDHVLPDSYFANNLRALSVDMAVFRDLLRVFFPKLSRQLDYLQYAAQDQTTGTSYEPPLTNVFTMQWFLTLFATCLPKDIVLRVWDSILLEGSEILLRTALAIWGKLSRRILSVGSADEFYSLMGTLTQDMMEGRIFDADSLIKFIYSCAPYPLPQLMELREKYTYNIRPFTNPANSNKKSSVLGGMLPSDEDDLDDDDLEAISCFGGILPTQLSAGKSKGTEGETFGSMADISAVGPGAYGNMPESNMAASLSPYMERMTTDINALKNQYAKLKQRQNQAHIIIAAASARQHTKARAMVPKIETPKAMNHLFVGKQGPPPNSKNRFVAASPRIALNVYPRSILVNCQNQQDKRKIPSVKSNNVEMKESVNYSQDCTVEKENQSCDLNKQSPDSDKVSCDQVAKSCDNELNSAGSDKISHDQESMVYESVSRTSVDGSEMCSEKIDNNRNCESDLNLNKKADSIKCDFNEVDKTLSNNDGFDMAESDFNQKDLDVAEKDKNHSMEHEEMKGLHSENTQSNTETSHLECTTYIDSSDTIADDYTNSDTVVDDNENSDMLADDNTNTDTVTDDNTKRDNVQMTNVLSNSDSSLQSPYSALDSNEISNSGCGEKEDICENFLKHSNASFCKDEISIGKSEKILCESSNETFSSEIERDDGVLVSTSHKDIHGINEVISSDSGFVEADSPRHSNSVQDSASYENFLEELRGDNHDKSEIVAENDGSQNVVSESVSLENVSQQQINYREVEISLNENRGYLENDEGLDIEQDIMQLLDSEERERIMERVTISGKYDSEEENSLNRMNKNSDVNTDSSISYSPNHSESSMNYSDYDSSPVFSPKDPSSPSHFADTDDTSCPESPEREDYRNTVPAQYLQSKREGNYKIAKPFNPFPVKHFNENRAKTGLKLGMYKSSTLQQIEKQSKRRIFWSK